jgi:hypothetical protein
MKRTMQSWARWSGDQMRKLEARGQRSKAMMDGRGASSDEDDEDTVELTAPWVRQRDT